MSVLGKGIITRRILSVALNVLMISNLIFGTFTSAFAQDGGTPTPTDTPTVTPIVTDTPTVEPTLEPAVEPTLEPTVEPTFEPTIEPTFEPTFELTPTPTSEPTPEPTDTTTPALYWEVVIVISPEQIAALDSSQYNSFSNLTASGVQYEILDDRIKFSGVESIDQLREAVFEDISPVIDFLGGPIELNVSMPVESNQELDINLETRLSAGYTWKFSQSTEDVQFIQSNEAAFFQRGEGF